MIDFATVMRIASTAGDSVAAFRDLFGHVVTTFGEDDQASLKAAYAAARDDSDAAHASVQAKLEAASKR